VKASIVNVKGDAITYRATVTVTGPEEVAGMVYVEAGTFTMGCVAGGEWTSADCPRAARVLHEVTLTKDFYIGKFEVTQAEWESLMGTENNPSVVKGSNLPVTNVSWVEAHTFIDKLNERDAGTGKQWRLPTEAEWEYAARGGNVEPKNCEGGCVYSGSNSAFDVAWNSFNSGGQPNPVGTKDANELGLHDMSGNVSEWVEDYWGSYTAESQTDPTGPAPNSDGHVIRDGSYQQGQNSMSVAYRKYEIGEAKVNTTGFRLALTITEPDATPTAKPTFFESASATVSGLWDSITK
jgi:formylglycine-generating enzyme required for sulfatase activity